MILKLQPLKFNKNRNQPFMVCDIEVSDWTKFLVLGLYDGETYETFEDLEDFFDYIFELGHKKLIIYAHFGGIFDFLFLIQESFNQYPKYLIENMIPRGSGLLSFDMSIRLNKKRCKITFMDSSAFLPFSLRSLSENFKVEHNKLEIDYEKITKVTPELIKYLEHDCKGLCQVIKKYRSWPLISRAGSKSTMASQALQVLRLFLSKPIHSLSDRADAFVRKSYFGGRTEIFKPFYQGKEPIYCYDVNSLYPTVMLENEFPNRCLRSTRKYHPEKMGFYDAEVEVPESLYVPPLGIVHEVNGSEKFIFPTGRFKGRWSTIELEYARSLGVKILSTGEGYIFSNGGFIFKDFIKELYDIRLKAKETDNKVDDILAKLLMNSCYGRFGLNRERENIVFDNGEVGLTPFTEIETKMGTVRLSKEKKSLDTFTNVAIAAWVTSLSRIYMHKIYMQCASELYYTDTDSLFTTKVFPESKDLGKLKLEYKAHEACFLLPKTYMVDHVEGLMKGGKSVDKKVVMKGFDFRKVQKFQLEDFQSALEGELRILRSEMPSKGLASFKTALKKGKVIMKKPEMSREIRAKYDKREIFKHENVYDSKPLHLG